MSPSYSSRQLTAHLASIARQQRGVLSRRQILEAGIAEGALRGRREAGRLLPVCAGVYAVGREIDSRESIWMAALLSVGRDACLSRRSAGALWGVLDWRAPVEVVSSGRGRLVRLKPPGVSSSIDVRATSSRGLGTGQVTIKDGIRVTTISRTLLDLAAVLTEKQMRYVFNEADRQGLLDQDDLETALGLCRGRRGSQRLRLLVDTRRPETAATRSELEVMFLELCRKAGLPPPEVNQAVCGYEVDCLWREQRVIVELDGFAFHRGAMAFHRDAERDNKLRLAGFRVLRFTYPAVKSSSQEVAAIVRSELKDRTAD